MCLSASLAWKWYAKNAHHLQLGLSSVPSLGAQCVICFDKSAEHKLDSWPKYVFWHITPEVYGRIKWSPVTCRWPSSSVSFPLSQPEFLPAPPAFTAYQLRMNRYRQAVKLENMAAGQAEALSKIMSRCQVQVAGLRPNAGPSSFGFSNE